MKSSRKLTLFASIVLAIIVSRLTFARELIPSPFEVPTGQLAQLDLEAGILVEAETGQILWGKEIHKQWPPASMVKMMLILITMEQLIEGRIHLDDNITVSARASKIGGSQVYLKHNEVFKLEELLKTVIVCSANDSSVAIAEHISGSVEGFVDMMNLRATDLGMKDTNFTSVDGLPPRKGEQGDLSSAYDLALLGMELIKYPQILEWGAIPYFGFREDKFICRNTNKLVGKFAGVDGIKTGYIKNSGWCCTITAKRDNLRFIAVVLGSSKNSTRFNEAARLLSYGFSNFKRITPIQKGEAVGPDINIKNGVKDKIKLVAKTDLSVIISKREENKIQIIYDFPSSLEAPLSKDEEKGKILIKFKDITLAEGVALVPEDIPKKKLIQKILPF